MKKNIYMGIVSFVLIAASASVVSSENKEEDNNNFNKNYQRHLEHDIPYMKINTDDGSKKKYDYIVDDESFDKIHPPISFNDEGYNPSSCRIKCPNKTLGSGTLVSLKKDENHNIRSEIMTAKHVTQDLNNQKKTMFPIVEQGITAFRDKRVAYLAKHEVDEVCYKPNSKDDIALLKGRIIENNYGDFILSSPAKIRPKQAQQKEISERVYINHYPFGLSTQRLNFGDISVNGSHTVSTLPGSSGAGIFNVNKQLSWIHSGENNPSNKKAFYDMSFLKRVPENEKIHNIAKDNESYPIFNEDIKEFTNCFKKV
jgi:hypothetical protein